MTAKQQRFVQEYLIDLNATRAAVRAGYSPRNAPSIASRLVKKSQVSAAIQQEMARRADRTQLTADSVLREYARIAFANLTDYVEFGRAGVFIKESRDLAADMKAGLLEVSQTRGQGVRVRLQNKLQALRDLADHLGLLRSTTADLVERLLVSLPEDLSREIRAAIAAATMNG